MYVDLFSLNSVVAFNYRRSVRTTLLSHENPRRLHTSQPIGHSHSFQSFSLSVWYLYPPLLRFILKKNKGLLLLHTVFNHIVKQTVYVLNYTNLLYITVERLVISL